MSKSELCDLLFNCLCMCVFYNYKYVFMNPLLSTNDSKWLHSFRSINRRKKLGSPKRAASAVCRTLMETARTAFFSAPQNRPLFWVPEPPSLLSTRTALFAEYQNRPLCWVPEPSSLLSIRTVLFAEYQNCPLCWVPGPLRSAPEPSSSLSVGTVLFAENHPLCHTLKKNVLF